MIQGGSFVSNIGAFLAGNQTQMPDMEAYDGKENFRSVRLVRRDYGKRYRRRRRKSNCYERDVWDSGRSVTDANSDPTRARGVDH